MADFPISEGQDSDDAYDKKHGKPDNGAPKMNEDELYGSKMNPVRDTPLAGKNLKDVGR